MGAYKPQQRYSSAYSECEFSESRVQNLSRDGYMPGDRPGTFQDNTQRKRYQLDPNVVESDWVASQAYRNMRGDWHPKGGFSGEVSQGTQHPKKSSQSSWPSRGVDSGGADNGGSGGGFRWK